MGLSLSEIVLYFFSTVGPFQQVLAKKMENLLVEITALRLDRIFQPMRALESRTGHMVYNLAYT